MRIIEPGQIIGVVDSIRRGRRWISCDAPAYRVYVKMWGKIKPLRPARFLICRTLGKIVGIVLQRPVSRGR